MNVKEINVELAGLQTELLLVALLYHVKLATRGNGYLVSNLLSEVMERNGIPESVAYELARQVEFSDVDGLTQIDVGNVDSLLRCGE